MTGKVANVITGNLDDEDDFLLIEEKAKDQLDLEVETNATKVDVIFS